MSNRQAEIEYLRLLEEEIKRNKRNQGLRVYKSFYPWQRKFNAATKDHDACMLMGSNQSGKSRTGCCISSFHFTGEYPEDWEGFKFDHPIMGWLLGYSGEKTRDLLQQKLFGRFENGEFEGGYIPKDRILGYRSMSGTPGAMREIRVKHTHGISTCQFWSYSQGQHALMGDVVDWYLIDEEPKDPLIYPQVLTRTINGDNGKGGRGLLTFTPENGKTQLVCQFMGEEVELDDDDEEVTINTNGMYLQGATWNECPHISEEKKARILSKYPKYQRKMRSEGVPLMGQGLIYEVDEDDIKCKPFDVPEHWFVINGMDFGFDHPQAHVQLVWDKDSDVFYVINAWKAKRKHPYQAWHIIKPWAENVPTAWPGDGLQHKQQEGKESKELRKIYEAEGFNMLPEHATWEDGGNGVWVGITQILNMMEEGRFKIVSSLSEVFEEIRQYHTKTTPEGNTKIVKIKDDLLDAIRYAYMMRRYAIRVMDLYATHDDYSTRKSVGRDIMNGY